MVLVNFQVAEPPPVPTTDPQTCTIKILEHTFGNSWGQPEIVQYFPPTDSGPPGSWAAVTLKLVVTSKGRQYDRLAVMSLDHTEIWRTSTPEPTSDGIIWTYTKDVTRYIPLFAKPGTFILELNNILTDTLTGMYNTILYATFYTASQMYPTAGQSNLIVPISAMLGTPDNYKPDYASVPPPYSVNVTLPQNTVEIYAELYASGNAKEEFWYFNAADKYIGDLPPDTTYGHGPFREVRLLVDDKLAGVAFPYAVIFTGGINLSVWRPITSYGAIDLPTYFLDLTPFAPTFADGRPHKITLDVVSAEKDHVINDNWYVSGLLQVITDPSGKPTTGKITRYNVQPYAVTQTSAKKDGTDITITVKAQRSLYIEADVVSGSGQKTTVSFQQDLDYTNTQYYLNNTQDQNLAQVSSGSVKSLHNGAPVVMDIFRYPLYINMSSRPNIPFYTTFDQAYYRQVVPAPFILGSTIVERQQAAGYFVTEIAENSNTFSYKDTKGNTYNREVKAVHQAVIFDKQNGSLAPCIPAPLEPSTASGLALLASPMANIPTALAPQTARIFTSPASSTVNILSIPARLPGGRQSHTKG